ncbi:c-type cytochrome [Sulfurovum sp. bin170]|uniref:c-type cytochrome n=1 Tax=Sulfurovum sp. bin170 TaxID=2695268 RepID=UPI0013E0E637|nr:c-type cytochrome [Sulfurovum sp. bin170]NEW60397.1 c-type cytochrome [Sulfurovum sp. bin170]
MKKIYLSLATLLLLTGCINDKPKQKLDGEELLTQKCASCHNLDMPPKNYDNEIAPSLMAVTFHLKDLITSSNPSEHKSKIISFVQDYVVNPTAEKSICDKASLDSYGLMPSQKGKVTDDEVEAMVEYMYEYYDNKKLLEQLAEERRLKNMPPHERVMEQKGCLTCHGMEKDKVVAPSFKMISDKYEKKDREMLIQSIKDGTKGKWENRKLPMPSFKKISDKDVEGVVDWILR